MLQQLLAKYLHKPFVYSILSLTDVVSTQSSETKPKLKALRMLITRFATIFDLRIICLPFLIPIFPPSTNSLCSTLFSLLVLLFPSAKEPFNSRIFKPDDAVSPPPELFSPFSLNPNSPYSCGPNTSLGFLQQDFVNLGKFRMWMYGIGSFCGLQLDLVSPNFRYLVTEKCSGVEERQLHMVVELQELGVSKRFNSPPKLKTGLLCFP